MRAFFELKFASLHFSSYLCSVITKREGADRFKSSQWGLLVGLCVLDVGAHVGQDVVVVVVLKEDVGDAPLAILDLHQPADGNALDCDGILHQKPDLSSAVWQ